MSKPKKKVSEMKPPGPRTTGQASRVVQGAANQLVDTNRVAVAKEIDFLKARLVEQKATVKAARMAVITESVEVGHTEVQLRGVQAMLGELIWD